MLEIGNEAEVVTSPDSVERLPEQLATGSDIKARAPMRFGAHQDVIDAPEGPVAADHVMVLGRIAVPRGARVLALPGVAVADAHAIE